MSLIEYLEPVDTQLGVSIKLTFLKSVCFSIARDYSKLIFYLKLGIRLQLGKWFLIPVTQLALMKHRNGNASEGIVGDMMDAFDDTPTTFDHIGLQHYIAGTNKSGGPLVTTSNTSFQSDLHIFESDGNTTVRDMSTSLEAFEAACFPVFEKMINTVPTGTILSDVIGPRQWITMESHLDLDSTGAVVYSGVIGHYTGKGGAPSPATASYQYGTTGGGNTGPKTSQSGGGFLA